MAEAPKRLRAFKNIEGEWTAFPFAQGGYVPRGNTVFVRADIANGYRKALEKTHSMLPKTDWYSGLVALIDQALAKGDEA